MLEKIGDLTNKIRNPFGMDVPTLRGEDFKEGFVIQELLSNGNEGETIVLAGNMMPFIPLKFGGSQRIKKEFYSGYSEPAMQIFGPEESDITINGEFKDAKFKPSMGSGIALEFQKQLDSMRVRGNIVKINLGQIERFGLISQTSFDLNHLGKIAYSITFSIIGFSAPKNAKFLNRVKEYPFSINKGLINAASDFEKNRALMPKTISLGIADMINRIISGVAEAIASITNFVDQILKSVGDIMKAVERAKGLIKHVQNKIKGYKRAIGGFNPFNSQQALTGRYENAKFYAGMGAALSAISAMLNKLRAQLSASFSSIPQARHLVKEGDTLQSVSIKFFGSADYWKKIFDYNNLTVTELQTGSILDIPRL
jgi:hypothetical protein